MLIEGGVTLHANSEYEQSKVLGAVGTTILLNAFVCTYACVCKFHLYKRYAYAQRRSLERLGVSEAIRCT